MNKDLIKFAVKLFIGMLAIGTGGTLVKKLAKMLVDLTQNEGTTMLRGVKRIRRPHCGHRFLAFDIEDKASINSMARFILCYSFSNYDQWYAFRNPLQELPDSSIIKH